MRRRCSCRYEAAATGGSPPCGGRARRGGRRGAADRTPHSCQPHFRRAPPGTCSSERTTFRTEGEHVMSRILIFAATAASVFVASTGTAPAADAPALCIGAPSHAVTAPDENGECKKGTLTPLADAQALAAIAARVDALESANSALQQRVGTLESDNTALAARVSALETTLSKVSYDATRAQRATDPHGLGRQPAGRRRLGRHARKGQRPREPVRRLRRAQPWGPGVRLAQPRHRQGPLLQLCRRADRGRRQHRHGHVVHRPGVGQHRERHRLHGDGRQG